MKIKIISVVGARPNFMKISPFIHAINDYNSLHQQPEVEHLLVHTGQHYDDCMSRKFFEDLDIPPADINLGIGSGSHAEQVGNTMIAFEKVLQKHRPDWVVVVGDVNATLSCSVTAKKERIKLCHIEAGLRSGDMSMPEEINRLVTDRLADLLLIPDLISEGNLLKEGVPKEKIVFTGNIMIDTLEKFRDKVKGFSILKILYENKHPDAAGNSIETEIKDFSYALMTMHRPSNVDNETVLKSLVRFFIEEVTPEIPLIWPIHPRTEKQLKHFGLWEKVIETKGLILLNPLGYLDMLRLNMSAKIMLTDSGGLQEECTVLGIPCLTMRDNTERPVTLQEHGGASVLVGNNVLHISDSFKKAMQSPHIPVRPELWDGHTAERCLKAIIEYKSL